MIRTAIIDLATNKIINLTEFAGEVPTEHLEGQLWVASDSAKIGDYWDGERVLVTEPQQPSLVALKDGAQAQIDAYFEALYSRSVVNSAIGAEYDAAYIVAKEWLKDTTKSVPERIKALAESYGGTNLQAAQVVAKWTEAQAVALDLRGAARLRAKHAIRQAVDAAGVAAAEAAGRAAMEAVAVQE